MLAIISAIGLLALSGWFISAAAYAGLKKAVADGLVNADHRIVVLNTGNGLKDVAGAMKSVELVGTTPNRVAPNLADLKSVMENI